MNLHTQRSHQLKAFISPLVCLLLVACGQKGALYIPEPKQQPAVSPQTLPEPGAAQPLSVPEQLELPAEEEDGIPEPAGTNESTQAPE